MAANKARGSSFSRNVAVATQPQIPGLKRGPNGNVFVSSGIPDLDIAVITFPPSLLSVKHMADTLLSVKAIPDEDKELAQLLTGYQDMVGLLNVHRAARINTQVPMILEATTFSIKLQKRRYLVLECLNQAPVDGSTGASYGTSGSSCSASSKNLDF